MAATHTEQFTHAMYSHIHRLLQTVTPSSSSQQVSYPDCLELTKKENWQSTNLKADHRRMDERDSSNERKARRWSSIDTKSAGWDLTNQGKWAICIRLLTPFILKQLRNSTLTIHVHANAYYMHISSTMVSKQLPTPTHWHAS